MAQDIDRFDGQPSDPNAPSFVGPSEPPLPRTSDPQITIRVIRFRDGSRVFLSIFLMLVSALIGAVFASVYDEISSYLHDVTQITIKWGVAPMKVAVFCVPILLMFLFVRRFVWPR